MYSELCNAPYYVIFSLQFEDSPQKFLLKHPLYLFFLQQTYSVKNTTSATLAGTGMQQIISSVTQRYNRDWKTRCSVSHAYPKLQTLKHERSLYSKASNVGADLHQHLIHLVCHLGHSHADLRVVGSCFSYEHWQVGVRRGNGWWCVYSSRGHGEHLLGTNCLLGHQRVELTLWLYICHWTICSLQQ